MYDSPAFNGSGRSLSGGLKGAGTRGARFIKRLGGVMEIV